ncbi:MAG: iron ABC transporter permease [Endomicrobium sp.]|jgi:iron complex transport system permease protein|nr:iron ABC transporter permease [Endomicrobium sp.]
MTSNVKTAGFFLAMLVVALASFLISLASGSNGISFFDSFKALFGMGLENDVMIIREIRFPRVIAAFITGAGLAASGCVFQAILKNPLADPFTLGVSGGAAFGTAACFVSGLAALNLFFLPFCSFAGALTAVLTVYLLSSGKRFDSNSMILSGVVISYVFSSAVMLLYSLSSSRQIQAAFMWLMGDLSMIDDRMLAPVSVIVLIAVFFLCAGANIINVLVLGGEKSETLGINTERIIKIVFLTASLIAALCVSLCGVIGFVGLMTPHIMRKITGANHIVLIPASALAGAAFLPLCDTLARTLFAPVIIPVGVITGIAGGTFFIFLLLRNGGKIL